MKKLLLFLMPALFLLSGCAKHYVKALPLLRKEVAPHFKTIDDVTVSYKVLSPHDSMTCLDQDVVKLGFQPIHLNIENKSAGDIIFSLDQIDQSCVSPQDVALKCIIRLLEELALGGYHR